MTAGPSPAPQELAEVLDPGWLSWALGHRHPGCEVAGTAVVETLQTVATKVRFVVDYHRPGDPPAPAALCVKGYFHEEGRRRPGAGIVETSFYRELAASVRARVAPCVYTGIDGTTGHGIVVMEDLVRAGARFLTALSPYSVDQAAATLDQLARLHAASWGAAGLDAPWLAPKLEMLTLAVDAARLQELMDRPRAGGLPSWVRDGQRIHAALEQLASAPPPAAACLVHGDVHAGNVFETASGPGLIDWQLVQRGSWAMDVAYHIGAVLDTDERRRSESALLGHYLDRLSAYGIEPPAWDEAVAGYRRYLAYGLYLWAMTQFVEEPVTTQFVRRLGHAVVDNGTFELLGV
ncbi:MAG TPA: phosphotransferase [Acidimicrobiales bacterium]|nr:phosphotransferase [Acidimicrobiales bacterium]